MCGRHWRGALLLLSLFDSARGRRSISVKLWAPWPTSVWSPLAEACEFVFAEMGSDAMWDYVEGIGPVTLDDSSSFADLVEKVTDIALKDETFGMRGALASRELAARIEAHRSIAIDGCEGKDAYVVLGDSVLACSPEEMVEKGEATSNLLLESARRGTSGSLVDLTIRGFGNDLFDWLRALSTRRMRLRWNLKPGLDKTWLPGFGVNLDIKNLEYKNWENVDDDAEDFLPEEPLAGIDFKRLAERKPEQLKNLVKARDSMDETTLKMWKIRDLSLQAAVAVAESSDPFETLAEIAQDVPAHASRLSSIKVTDEARSAADLQARYRARSGMGGATLFVGGAGYSLDSPTLSIYALLRAVRAERKYDDQPFVIPDLDNDQTSPSKRIDVLTGSKGAVSYLNNLEKDAMYQRWPSSVKQFSYPSWQLHSVAKNVYTCLVVMDLATPEALDAVQIIGMMIDQGYPVRFGITPLTRRTRYDDDLDDAEDEDSSITTETETMARIFGAAKLARGPRTAFGVLRTVAEEMEDPLEVYARIVSSKKGLYADEPKNPDLDLSSPKAAKKQFDKLDLTAFLNSSRTFAEAHNLVVDCFSLNGRIRPLSALQSDMLHMLGDEQQYISNLVARGQITDRTKSIYGKTLLGEGKENVAQRYSTNTARLLIDQENAPNVAYEDLRVDEWEHVDVGTVSVIAVCDEKTKRGAGLARLVRGLVEDENVARVAVVESASGSNYALFNGRRVDSPKGSEPLDLDEVRKVVVGHEAEIAEVILEDSLADYSGDEDKLDVLQRVRCLAGERSKKPRVAARSAISTLSVDPFTVLASKEREASVVAVVDPLTEGAQRAASVLLALKELVSVSLVLTPTPDLHELPLQKYYRFAVEFSAPDYAGESIGCEFSSLPSKQVLTLRVDTPEAWDVQTAVATQDLDNIQLTSEDLVIEYQLKSLVVAGQCYDLRDRRPPNGLQVELAPLGADTLVMQNLGYFQLRGQPGVFDIKLKPGSRSSQLYDVLAPPEYKDSAVGVPVVVADLDGGATQLRVRKKKGFEDAELLLSSTDGEEEQVVSAEVSVEPNSLLKRMFANKGGNNNKEEEEQQETVHVFSLATGSLYERFLKIMMLSVRKRTTGPVKFWLFENYLSPSFKQDAEALASGRGFEVSYVTYKWPEWLRRQTVKQRIIWGYKILFLDVLFPLGVPKIIYVDADQVVRGDLRELWNLDLKGRPYGYTPFCDSRPETLGFQFWRSGYWADHLRGKPYHISALYVVDLVKFRQMAVGDQLRAVYDQLSRDPNSLSNLDQDLPNYAQHSIPIFSLPQEWLWCESWCDDDSKGESKTIDLCNNPLHKENKLMMAKRVINGSLFQESWDDLDQEVKAICGGEARVL